MAKNLGLFGRGRDVLKGEEPLVKVARNGRGDDKKALSTWYVQETLVTQDRIMHVEACAQGGTRKKKAGGQQQRKGRNCGKPLRSCQCRTKGVDRPRSISQIWGVDGPPQKADTTLAQHGCGLGIRARLDTERALGSRGVLCIVP
jgi:hypothetical protein